MNLYLFEYYSTFMDAYEKVQELLYAPIRFDDAMILYSHIRLNIFILYILIVAPTSSRFIPLHSAAFPTLQRL